MNIKNNVLFRRKMGHDSIAFRIFTHIVLIIACVIAIFPVLRVLSVSLRPGDRLLSTSLRIIPEGATLDNYRDVLFKKDFFLWLWNSVLISVSTAFIGLMLAATSAYAFSRWNFKGKKAGLVFLLSTQMIPATMMMVPLYILAARFGFINTYRGLVLAYSVGSIPFSVWMLKGYYDTIPNTLEEAAMIDGATRMQTFYRIILPLALPGLSIAFLFNFMNSWKDFLLARIMLQKDFLFTWPLGLQQLQGQFRTAWGMFAAASILVAIPVVALFIYTSRYLVSGLTLGSVKGD
ncbi:sugar ABC transporter permease [Spirochaetia bacterium 38H-sp]|uniref:Maltose/maltodextrin transport system permease protein MalG n=1 Tax=Rarispira pelagica TaxID=3141764 RepID=A0ABU9UDY1_9SPIR